MRHGETERLARFWPERWAAGPPVAHEFKHAYTDRWVRFYSLPEGKRYAEDEAEHGIVLDRYNTVLDELFAGEEVYVVTTDWSVLPWGRRRSAERRKLHPAGVLWTTDDDTEDADPVFHSRAFFYADRRPWQRGCLDRMLRAVADDALSGVFVTDVGLTRIHHPYDGGADVILTGPEERDRLRARHTDWLSPLPSGL